MDRIANNESLVICAILNALVGDVNQMAKLYLIVVMSVDRAIRNRVERYSSYNDMVRAESGFDRALNRKFIEMQLVFLNAMTMLMLSGKIEKQEKNRLDLTSDGAKMAFDFQNIEGIVVDEVKTAVMVLSELCKGKDDKSLYTDLKIVL